MIIIPSPEWETATTSARDSPEQSRDTHHESQAAGSCHNGIPQVGNRESGGGRGRCWRGDYGGIGRQRGRGGAAADE